RAECDRSATRETDVVIDVDRTQRVIDRVDRHTSDASRNGQPGSIALEQQLTRATELDVSIGSTGDGLHVLVPVISCAMPGERAERCALANPAVRAIVINSSVSGRYSPDRGR